jgi:Lon protease-like protein
VGRGPDPDVTRLPRLIPLFPLPNVVLFPKVPLPLHVFEPRYRKMTTDVLESHRIIGMTLLRAGWRADCHGRPPVYPIGCAGRVEKWEALEGGRFNITLRGLSRFRIVEEHEGEPYRVATIDPLGDLGADDAALDEARRKVLAAIGKASDGPAVLVIQPSIGADVLVNALSQTLDLTPVERQSLLDCDTLLGRYGRLLEILEFKQLEQTFGRGPDTVH